MEHDEPLQRNVRSVLDAVEQPEAEADAMARIEERIEANMARPRNKRLRSPRGLRHTALATAALVVLVSAGAFAAPTALDGLFGDDDSAANRMEVFRDDDARPDELLRVFREPASRFGTPGAQLRMMYDSLEAQAQFEMEHRDAHHMVLADDDDRLLPRRYLRELVRVDEPEFDFTMLALPTRSGRVCTVTSQEGSMAVMTCNEGLTTERLVTAGMGRRQQELVVQGITVDDVSGVSIALADGRVQPAIMGLNAFVWHTGDARRDVAWYLRLTLNDGSDVSTTMAGAPFTPPCALGCARPG